MVDTQAIGDPLVDQRERERLGGCEHVRVLYPDRREVADCKEPPVVQSVAVESELGGPPGLRLDQPVQRGGVAAEGRRCSPRLWRGRDPRLKRRPARVIG